MSDQERAARLLSFVCDLVEKGVPRERVYETMSPADRECIREFCDDAFAEMKKSEEEAVSEKWWGEWFVIENMLTYADTNLFIFLSQIKTPGDMAHSRKTVCAFKRDDGGCASLSDFEMATAELLPVIFAEWKRLALQGVY